VREISRRRRHGHCVSSAGRQKRWLLVSVSDPLAANQSAQQNDREQQQTDNLDELPRIFARAQSHWTKDQANDADAEDAAASS